MTASVNGDLLQSENTSLPKSPITTGSKKPACLYFYPLLSRGYYTRISTASDHIHSNEPITSHDIGLMNLLKLLKLGTEDQANLVKPVTKAGVYMALTSTDSCKSPPGKDSFQSFFYKTCWDVVRDGVWKFVRNASATVFLLVVDYGKETLSPFLFVIAMEKLACLITDQKVADKAWKPIRVSREGGPGISHHLFFADHVLLFMRAQKWQACLMDNVLSDFCKASDIKVNHEKSRSMCSTDEEDIQEELDLVARNDLDLKMQDAPQSSSELLQSDSMNYRA
ncbi:hypothetical protein OIU78_013310 [Salix suchowensis]|nr:hypothetical protein OIU78_013310 [Salix suchowensis]